MSIIKDKSIENFPWENEHIVIKGTPIRVVDFIKKCLELKTKQEVSLFYGIAPGTLTTYIARDVPELVGKGNLTLDKKVLKLFEYKVCSKCKKAKPFLDFSKRHIPSKNYSGLFSYCRSCCRNPQKEVKLVYPIEKATKKKTFTTTKQQIRSMQTSAKRLKRFVSWADIEAIDEFRKNCPEGYVVDHIIPLCNAKVSGLNVLENLQYLTKEENRIKGNSWEQE